MPGCGKSTLARLLGERLNRPVVELDRLIEETAGLSIPEIFAAQGESGFRVLETQALPRGGQALRRDPLAPAAAASPGRRTIRCCTRTAASCG